LLERAIGSVLRQSYANWELLVVDDASTDDTWALLQKYADNDPRIRAFRLAEQRNSSGARNYALDHAQGDVVVYLDDDNRFDADWVRAVAWAFSEYPETQVAYGARVVDDDVRHQGRPGRSMPIVQFLAWERDAMLESNRVDQNVIATRSSFRWLPCTTTATGTTE
jgi:glycosyltransferase involved in cell wall biosynthesis